MVSLQLKENYRLLGGNMSAEQQRDATEYAEFILAIGEKRFQECTMDKIQLPKVLQLPNNKTEKLIASVYGNLTEKVPTSQYLAERAILAPRNLDVAYINDIVLDLLPGETTTYFSADTVTEGAAELYFSEYLNSLTLSGMPYRRLSLKIGATVILLRNLSPLHGLCNGTRLQITHLGRNFIGGIILTGTCKGQTAYLPRIEITSSPDSDLGFQLNRRQYPIRLAFAMTINKSQGQSLEVVGVGLHQEKSQFASRSVTSVRRSGRAIANLARLGVPLFLQTLPSRGTTSGSVRHFSGDRAFLLKPATGSPFSPGRLPGAFWRSRTFAGTTSGRLPALLRFAGRVPLLLGRPLDFFWRSRVFAGRPLASPRSLPDGVWLPVLCSSGV